MTDFPGPLLHVMSSTHFCALNSYPSVLTVFLNWAPTTHTTPVGQPALRNTSHDEFLTSPRPDALMLVEESHATEFASETLCLCDGGVNCPCLGDWNGARRRPTCLHGADFRSHCL